MTDPRALEQRALALLRRGDGVGALPLLRSLTDRSPDAPAGWLYLGEAARIAGDDETLNRAAERLLELEPRTVRALVWKGDLLERAGDPRLAAGFYNRAVRSAERMTDPPASLKSEIARAAAAVERLEAAFADHLDTALSQRLDAGPRLRRAIDILSGRATVTMQQPTLFYFPGLVAREFFERDEFDWASAIELATPAIRAELGDALGQRGLFTPYLTRDHGGVPRDRHELIESADWSALHLMDKGEPNPALANRFPRHARCARQRAAVPRARSRADGDVLAAEGRRTHPAAPRHDQHPSDLPSPPLDPG